MYSTIIPSYRKHSREKIGKHTSRRFFKIRLIVASYGYSLPLQIGSGISLKNYNTFLERNEKVGYKFRWDQGHVYIVDMANTDHEAVVSALMDYFKTPNNGVIRGPIKVLGQPYHYNPINHGEKIAPDIAVFPNSTDVPRPTVPYPGPPPSDANGFSHARIIVEVANTQDIRTWNTRCELWMREQYVRYVFGIKLDIVRNNGNRSMLARLWTRENPAPAGFVAVTNPNLPGVSVKNWDFGTLLYGTNNPTTCTRAGLPIYQVTIPIPAVFWDPPIVINAVTGVRTTNTVGYGVAVPVAITVPNFVIDLFEIQQEALDTQRG
ncbi:4866_t:CDS:2 [Cetraspora pellucida]|uniref:4866_t:CDS:1 n=1 Tax=Cetraspora pellucida TaxID=1433469 RepID=A0A9N9FL99_9GLOM|nr:4866_t:CDS:2 [Cetraspora pellucida]